MKISDHQVTVFLHNVSQTTLDRNAFVRSCEGESRTCAGTPASTTTPPTRTALSDSTKVDGTPLDDVAPEDPLELVRTIATARILMPRSMVRLSAGRMQLTDEAQALCFIAGANSVFLGDRLLTTPNPGESHDERLFDKLGMHLMPGEVDAVNAGG